MDKKLTADACSQCIEVGKQYLNERRIMDALESFSKAIYFDNVTLSWTW